MVSRSVMVERVQDGDADQVPASTSQHTSSAR